MSNSRDGDGPFNLRHKNAWMVVTGGMIILGTINVGLGYLFWPSPAVEDTSVPIPDVRAVIEAAAARSTDAGARPDDASITADDDAGVQPKNSL